jgi:hypothetical protein
VKQWEQLEEYIDSGVTGFCSLNVAHDLKVDRRRASRIIKAYVDAQRRPRSLTAYVLRRSGRTSSAWWYAGVRSDDVRQLTAQCVDDIGVTIREALIPDLNRMALLNPRCAALVDAIEGAFVANLNLLATAVP